MHLLLKSMLRGCSKYKGQSANKSTTSGSKKGRPKGSKNINRHDVELSDYMKFLQEKIVDVQEILKESCIPAYLLFDGELGNNYAVQMTREIGLHLISKLRCDSELYLPWAGEYGGRGPKRIYGERVHPDSISNDHLKLSEEEEGIRTEYFKFIARHKKFADPLNIVVMRKTNLKSGKVAHIILFSSDLDLSWDKIVDYYRLRFQIEFNFRDAKQYWGLEDFMVTRETKVRNSANIGMFMVNISHVLIARTDGKIGRSVHDLKMWFLARKQVIRTLKYCGQKADDIFIQDITNAISMKTMVHPIKMDG